MKIVNSSEILVRLVAANKLRQRGFEVYTLPASPLSHFPDLVAYRNGRFYNIYLFESAEAYYAEFSKETRKSAFEYAKPINAVVASMIVRLTVSKQAVKQLV